MGTAEAIGKVHGAENRARTPDSRQASTEARLLPKALRGLWLAYYLSSFALAAGIQAHHADAGEHLRDIVAAFGVIVGTIIGLAQIPNRRLPLAPDEDLVAFSLAFLGVGGMLPLASSFSANSEVGVGMFGLSFVLLLLLVFWNRRGKKKRRGLSNRPRDETPQAADRPPQSSGS